jgi:hypothetical protein
MLRSTLRSLTLLALPAAALLTLLAPGAAKAQYYYPQQQQYYYPQQQYYYPQQQYYQPQQQYYQPQQQYYYPQQQYYYPQQTQYYQPQQQYYYPNNYSQPDNTQLVNYTPGNMGNQSIPIGGYGLQGGNIPRPVSPQEVQTQQFLNGVGTLIRQLER